MRVKINDNWVNIPSTISEISLKQRIDFQIEHGNLLDEIVKSIYSIEDETERMMEFTQFQFEKMYRTFAFFAGTTVEAVKESEFLDDIASIYYSTLRLIFDEEQNTTLLREFLWNGELWYLREPELKNGDKMSFGEFIDSKQIIQDLHKLSKSQWESLLPLSCIYLRRKDEIYEERFLYEDSERMKLMESLPLDIAIQVGFFLTSSLNMFIAASQSSSPQGLKAVEKTLRDISKTSAGLTSSKA